MNNLSKYVVAATSIFGYGPKITCFCESREAANAEAQRQWEVDKNKVLRVFAGVVYAEGQNPDEIDWNECDIEYYYGAFDSDKVPYNSKHLYYIGGSDFIDDIDYKTFDDAKAAALKHCQACPNVWIAHYYAEYIVDYEYLWFHGNKDEYGNDFYFLLENSDLGAKKFERYADAYFEAHQQMQSDIYRLQNIDLYMVSDSGMKSRNKCFRTGRPHIDFECLRDEDPSSYRIIGDIETSKKAQEEYYAPFRPEDECEKDYHDFCNGKGVVCKGEDGHYYLVSILPNWLCPKVKKPVYWRRIEKKE